MCCKVKLGFLTRIVVRNNRNEEICVAASQMLVQCIISQGICQKSGLMYEL